MTRFPVYMEYFSFHYFVLVVAVIFVIVAFFVVCVSAPLSFICMIVC